MIFRPFVMVQKLIPGREYPPPSDTFPITRLISSYLFLPLCIAPPGDPPWRYHITYTVSLPFRQNIVNLHPFCQRTSTCTLVDAPFWTPTGPPLSSARLALAPAPTAPGTATGPTARRALLTSPLRSPHPPFFPAFCYNYTLAHA
jgi:hypothetical protein